MSEFRREIFGSYKPKCETKVLSTGEHCPNTPKYRKMQGLYVCDQCFESFIQRNISVMKK